MDLAVITFPYFMNQNNRDIIVLFQDVIFFVRLLLFHITPVCIIGLNASLAACIKKVLQSFMFERFNHIDMRNLSGYACQYLFPVNNYYYKNILNNVNKLKIIWGDIEKYNILD
jgi:hypothetical protein